MFRSGLRSAGASRSPRIGALAHTPPEAGGRRSRGTGVVRGRVALPSRAFEHTRGRRRWGPESPPPQAHGRSPESAGTAFGPWPKGLLTAPPILLRDAGPSSQGPPTIAAATTA